MAADYPTEKIRNVVLLGHSHDGKTALAEAMLFASGAIPRLGSPDQQTATMDFEPEEQRRKISINLGVAFAEHAGFKINILDAPGFFDFAGQALSGLRAAEGAVVIVGPSGQLAVGTEIAKLVDECSGQLIEAAAESDGSLLEKYLDAGTLNEEEIQRGLREGIRTGKVAPVLCCSATKLLGVRTLMSTIAELLPPAEGDPSKPSKAFVFSTGGDQFGRVSYFKVVAGSIKADQHLTNLNRGGDERLAQIFFPRGKEHVAAGEVHAGDIGAVTKLTHTLTGDTLGAKDGGPVPTLDLPPPAYSLAITPKARGDEEKISSGLARLAEEDPTLHVERV